MGAGPTFNIEIETKKYADSEAVDHALNHFEILLRNLSTESSLDRGYTEGTFHTEASLLFGGVEFDFSYQTGYDEYAGSDVTGFLIQKQVYYDADMEDLLPELEVMYDLYEELSDLIKSGVEFTATCYTI